jgi:2-polyprenyl-3-methyl-5-hydroxy-6-metoxy-1,4-benzoquinol methylase
MNQMAQSAVEPSTEDYLLQLLTRYRTDHLVGVTPAAFRKQIDAFHSLRDHAMEGYSDPTRQRDLSIQFHWGHDHDFGSFALQGRMGKRHLWLLTNFMDEFRAMPRRLEGKRVLDIGCWTGGTSLLLAAMGAQVLAIEEVQKYVDAVNYLKTAFAISNLEVRRLSMYELDAAEFQDQFDYILFAGVLYHVTDPVIALRLTFNCLKDGGSLLLETMASHTPDSAKTIEYWGPTAFTTPGTVDQLSRGGWNWFVPSRQTIAQMLADVGFEQVRTTPVADQRAFATAIRTKHTDMLRAGLARPNLR